MKARILASLLLALILPLALPVHAQDSDLSSEEEELVIVVQDAVNALFTIDTFQMRIESLLNQTVGSAIGDQDIVVEQNSDSQVVTTDGEISESYTILSQVTSIALGPQSQEIPLTIETVLKDGQFYMRFSDVSAEMSGLLPEGWLLPEDLALPGFDASVIADLAASGSKTLTQISLDTITAIEERESATIDGQEMRVISVSFDADTLLELTGMDAAFDFEAMGVGEDFMQKLLEAAVYDYIIYIGVDDGLPHRIDNLTTITDLELNIQGQSLTLSQDITATTTYFGFGEPVEIPEPVLGE